MMALPSQFHRSLEFTTLVISCLLAEFFGYWLHRLLHSDGRFHFSAGTSCSSFLIYGPGQPMRHDHYQGRH